MNLIVEKIKEDEKLILAHLLELYEYDFSEYNHNDVSQLGLYGYSYLDYYWTEDNRFAYFIKIDGKYAGFVMICDYCYVSKNDDRFFMSEFFVMKKYRKQGIGMTVLKKIFDLHKGKWELSVYPKNKPSVNFWKKAIHEYAKNLYQCIENVPDIYDDSDAIVYLFEV